MFRKKRIKKFALGKTRIYIKNHNYVSLKNIVCVKQVSYQLISIESSEILQTKRKSLITHYTANCYK